MELETAVASVKRDQKLTKVLGLASVVGRLAAEQIDL